MDLLVLYSYPLFTAVACDKGVIASLRDGYSYFIFGVQLALGLIVSLMQYQGHYNDKAFKATNYACLYISQ